MKKLAVIYDRASDERQADNDSRENARNKLPLVAEKYGYEWEYRPEVKSGKLLSNRPVLMQILEEIRQGKIQALVLQDLDRLGRFVKEADIGLISDVLIETKTPVITLERVWKFWTRTDRMAGLKIKVGIIAVEENEDRTRRVSNAMIERAERGSYNGGRAVFGYDIKFTPTENPREKPKSDWIINQEEKPLVELIFSMYLEMQSASGVAKELNKLGYRRLIKYTKDVKKSRWATNRRPFETRDILRIIRNPLYAGFIAWGKTLSSNHTKDYERQFVFREDLQIIVGEVWERANEIRKSRKLSRKAHGKWSNKTYTGFLICPTCGGPMFRSTTSKPSGKTYEFYYCRPEKNYGCEKRRSVSEAIVTRALIPLMADLIENAINFDQSLEEAARQYNANGIEESLEQKNRAELLQIGEAKTRLIKSVSSGLLTDAEVKSEMGALRDREYRINRELQFAADKERTRQDYLEAIELFKQGSIQQKLERMYKLSRNSFRRILELIFEPGSITVIPRRIQASKKWEGVIESYTLTESYKSCTAIRDDGQPFRHKLQYTIDLSDLLVSA